MKKRIFDVLLSSTALVALSPLLAGLALATAINVGSPIIFTQSRVGQNKKIFNIYKFRSMDNSLDSEGNLLPDCERVNRFGKFIRKYGLDELPQLFNILTGDMSFVGPRPRSSKGSTRYNVPDTHSKIFSVRPGLTGPTQIAKMYRGEELTLKEKLKMDFDYAAKPPSILQDVWMIVSTVPVFIKGNGSKISTSKPDFF